MTPVAVQALAGRTDAMAQVGCDFEVLRAKQRPLVNLGALVPQRIGLGFVLLLPGVARVAAAIVGIGDTAPDVAFIERLHIGLAVVARIRTHYGVGAQQCLQALYHRNE